MQYDYDLFVIGAGSGGVRASRMAAARGVKVGIAEEYRVGGTCVIRGCIPKKLLVYGSHVREELEDAAGFGWEIGSTSFSWSRLIANKDKEIDRLNGVYLKLLQNSGVELHQGRAVIEDPHTVRVGGRALTAKHLLIATGSRPAMPAIPGIEHAITSNEAFHLPALPRRVVVVGGGYIALEFAGIFHGFGSHTRVIYRGEQILRGFDDDVRTHLYTEMTKKGVEIERQTDVSAITKQPDGTLTVQLTTGKTVECDAVLYAVGRHPNTAGLGLKAVGVTLGANDAVVVDDYSRTNIESIYAVGDVTARLQLTPVALAESMALVATLFDGKPTRPDHTNVPVAVFSQPSVSVVGMTETEARAAYGAVDIYKSSFKPLKHTLSGRDARTFMKLVVDGASQRVLGAHMVGPDAAEIIQGLAIAIKMNATKQQFDATVGIHPTAAEEFVTMREKWKG